jgi:hypothetical protein
VNVLLSGATQGDALALVTLADDDGASALQLHAFNRGMRGDGVIPSLLRTLVLSKDSEDAHGVLKTLPMHGICEEEDIEAMHNVLQVPCHATHPPRHTHRTLWPCSCGALTRNV